MFDSIFHSSWLGRRAIPADLTGDIALLHKRRSADLRESGGKAELRWPVTQYFNASDASEFTDWSGVAPDSEALHTRAARGSEDWQRTNIMLRRC
jgi:hypothetical protein